MPSASPDSYDLNFSNRPVRTRMPGGVAGVRLNRRPLCRLTSIQKTSRTTRSADVPSRGNAVGVLE